MSDMAQIELPEHIHRSLSNYITMKLQEYGWLTTGHENEEFLDAIINSLYDPQSSHFNGLIPLILAKEGTQIAVAEVLCTKILQDTSPNDEEVLSFTETLVQYYRDLCFNQSISNGAIKLDFLRNGDPPSHNSTTSTMLRPVSPTGTPDPKVSSFQTDSISTGAQGFFPHPPSRNS
jgi:hypothetical protein